MFFLALLLAVAKRRGELAALDDLAAFHRPVLAQYTLPFLSQAWFFATPVAYSALLVPAHLRMWIGINPMAGVVQGFRWTIIGHQAGQVGHLMLLSFGVVLLLLAGGLEYFRRVERSFADVV